MGKIEIEDIGRLQVKDGDVIVLKFKGPLSFEALYQIHAEYDKKIAPSFPNVRFMVLENGAELEVLTNAGQN